MPVNPNYDDPEVYTPFADTEIPDDCGCGIIGLVAVKDCSGNITGYLTPNDAEVYKNSTLECPPGYVKVFNRTTGEFVGILTVAEAMEYLTFLETLTP